MFEYFKIVAATEADRVQLLWVLQNKRFYPEATSVPPLPLTPLGGFDYREFLILWRIDSDGMPIVRTRSMISLANFSVNIVPTADWTARYRLSVAPTIQSVNLDLDPFATRTSKATFLSYNYPNPQPGEI